MIDKRVVDLVEQMRKKHDVARNMIPHNHRRIKNAFDEYAESVEQLFQYLVGEEVK